MDYQEQLQHAKKKAKKIAIISVVILIFMTFIIGIIGGLNKEERTEKLVEELSGNSFEGSIVSVGTPYKWKFNFEDDSTGEIYSEYVSEYSGLILIMDILIIRLIMIILESNMLLWILNGMMVTLVSGN